MALPYPPAGPTSPAAAGSSQFLTHILTVKDPIVGGGVGKGGCPGMLPIVLCQGPRPDTLRIVTYVLVLVSPHPP